MIAAGLMSGTSLDGIDTVLCEIEGIGTTTKVKQLAFHTYEMPEGLKKKIKKCCANEGHPDLICSLNFELGVLFANAVETLCKETKIPMKSLAFVASHGQTIFHIPRAYDGFIPSTLQIGESAVIAYRCGCPVIANFRVMDMAAGGEGAPLVPYSEYVLYRDPVHAIALQNIGGIGNVTILPAGGEMKDVFAFDTGPGNMMIDEAMHHFYHVPYDEGGKMAAKGTCIKELMEELKAHPYIVSSPPKSTGREMFGVPYTQALIKRYPDALPQDIIATLTWYTAYTIAENYRRFVLPKHDIKEVILGGGGAHNETLRAYLSKELPQIDILTQEDKGYSSDAKEAIAFVILGNQTLHHQPSNVPNATGAHETVILGNITYP